MSVLNKAILAVITTDRERSSGGAPIFFARDQQEMEEIAFQLEVILDAMAHQIGDGLMIMVKH